MKIQCDNINYIKGYLEPWMWRKGAQGASRTPIEVLPRTAKN